MGESIFQFGYNKRFHEMLENNFHNFVIGFPEFHLQFFPVLKPKRFSSFSIHKLFYNEIRT